MKTIKTLVEIPAKYKWMAQDWSGRWYAYTRKPKCSESFSGWLLPEDHHGDPVGDAMSMHSTGPNKNWKQTLQRIHEYEDVSDE